MPIVEAVHSQLLLNFDRLTPPSPEKEEDDTVVDIVYDVYAPGKRFKKTDPGDPDFHLAVVDDAGGGGAEVPRLAGAASGSVPLLVAFVSPAASVAFYNFTEISLPIDITMG